jgi:hypothetical protein
MPSIDRLAPDEWRAVEIVGAETAERFLWVIGKRLRGAEPGG